MIALRTLAAVSAAGLAALLPSAVPMPASAHGSVSSPMSRVVSCGPDGGQRAESAACVAARAVNGASFDGWDNLRVPNVRGKDREVIPDGKLCSAGLEEYQGLDLARADWPATTLRGGAAFTFTYRQTIPHKGTFRLYVTKTGYSATRKLRWSDLAAEPFLSVTDPPLKGDSYVIKGKLPTGRTGRHLIYTVWQNSDTPDTYYSCSDVVFASKSGGASGGPAVPGDTESAPASREDGDTAAPILVATSRRSNLPLVAAVAGAVLAAATLVGGAVVIRRRGRTRLGGAHRA